MISIIIIIGDILNFQLLKNYCLRVLVNIALVMTSQLQTVVLFHKYSMQEGFTLIYVHFQQFFVLIVIWKIIQHSLQLIPIISQTVHQRLPSSKQDRPPFSSSRYITQYEKWRSGWSNIYIFKKNHHFGSSTRYLLIL